MLSIEPSLRFRGELWMAVNQGNPLLPLFSRELRLNFRRELYGMFNTSTSTRLPLDAKLIEACD